MQVKQRIVILLFETSQVGITCCTLIIIFDQKFLLKKIKQITLHLFDEQVVINLQ